MFWCQRKTLILSQVQWVFTNDTNECLGIGDWSLTKRIGQMDFSRRIFPNHREQCSSQYVEKLLEREQKTKCGLWSEPIAKTAKCMDATASMLFSFSEFVKRKIAQKLNLKNLDFATQNFDVKEPWRWPEFFYFFLHVFLIRLSLLLRFSVKFLVQ